MLILGLCGFCNAGLAAGLITGSKPYKPGDCYYLIDPENGNKGNKDHALKIEEVTNTHYIYRWWIPDYKNKRLTWALETNTLPKKVIEKVTKKLNECPDKKRK